MGTYIHTYVQRQSMISRHMISLLVTHDGYKERMVLKTDREGLVIHQSKQPMRRRRPMTKSIEMFGSRMHQGRYDSKIKEHHMLAED